VTVLVVDDDVTIRELISDILEIEGYDVATANDGAQALQLVRQTSPEVILLDLMMPVMNGWEFAEACSADELCKDIPVLLMSAMHDVNRVIASLSHNGPRSVLRKPFNLEHLIAEVERYAPKH
jgi:CheY-like chemotaxis protein